MSQQRVSPSGDTPGGTDKQGMLLHTPKSSRLAPYIPQKAPEAMQSGTKKALVSPCAHSVPQNSSIHPPAGDPCLRYLQGVPFLEGQLVLLRRLEAVQGHRLHGCGGAAGGVPGLPGARTPQGCGVGAEHTVRRRRRAGNSADVSAAEAPRGPCRGHSCPDVRGRRGKPCQPTRVPGDPCAKGWQQDLALPRR